MVRDQGAVSRIFTKEVVVNVLRTPGWRQIALSSMLTETHESMMLRITLATANDEAH